MLADPPTEERLGRPGRAGFRRSDDAAASSWKTVVVSVSDRTNRPPQLPPPERASSTNVPADSKLSKGDGDHVDAIAVLSAQLDLRTAFLAAQRQLSPSSCSRR